VEHKSEDVPESDDYDKEPFVEDVSFFLGDPVSTGFSISVALIVASVL
jgi:hypothetical protein